MKKRFKSVSLIVAMLVLSLVFGSVAPLAAPAEASARPTINGQAVDTRRIGAQRGRGGVELALASSLRTALQHASVSAVVEITPGSMLVRHGSRELFILADSRTAFLTTGIGTASPSTRNVTLTALPRTVAARDLFVPFADVVRHLGGSFTSARVATVRNDAPDAAFDFTAAGQQRNVVTTGVYQDAARMIGRGATFPNSLYGSAFAGTDLAAPANPWLERYFFSSQDLSSGLNPEARVGYNRITVGGATTLDTIPAGGATSGSGMGVDSVRLRLADFGGTDMISQVPAAVLEAFPAIPTAKGGVAVIFNLVDRNGVRITNLNLTADVIARIFLGQISHWNDAALVRLNPRVALPATPIQVNWRPDVSGTTEIFTAYLAAASRVWRDTLTTEQETTVDMEGPGATSIFTPGVGGWTAALLADRTRTQAPASTDGGSALRGRVAAAENSIGFVSFGDVTGRNVTTAPVGPFGIARVQNRAGIFTLPLISNVYAAGIGHGNVLRHPVNSANPGAYPITGLTWILVERDPGVAKPIGDSVQVATLNDNLILAQPALTGTDLEAAVQRNAIVADFVDWAVVEGFGDAEARRLHMAPLTPTMKREVARLLGTIRVN
ncbi:MAG: substrate-binding domain-containing protein [Clostridium sp.]|nr:substrate-binding domain-containing protein [Clostridium sp.]